MNDLDKMILFFSFIIIALIFLAIVNFIKKNKDLISKIRKRKVMYDASVINKRHYTDNNHNLYYVEFAFNDESREFLVKDYIYNSLKINQKGILVLYLDSFFEFK